MSFEEFLLFKFGFKFRIPSSTVKVFYPENIWMVVDIAGTS